MIRKQTSKQAEWKTQPDFKLVQRFVSACVKFFFLLETNCSTDWVSQDQTPKEKMGEARPAFPPELAGTPRVWNTRLSYPACLSTFLFSSSFHQHSILAYTSHPCWSSTIIFVFPVTSCCCKLLCVLWTMINYFKIKQSWCICCCL